jgi:hypothetical protein
VVPALAGTADRMAGTLERSTAVALQQPDYLNKGIMMKFNNFCVTGSMVLISTMTIAGCSKPAPPKYDAVERLQFNRRAAELYLPIFWREDTNKNNAIDADELAVLIGFGNKDENDRSHWIDSSNQFTPAFVAAYQSIAAKTGETTSERLKLVQQELAQGRATLVETDMSQATPGESAMLKHLVNVAKHIENIYQQQKGTYGLDAAIPATDLSSRMVFYRNQSPFCEAPDTNGKPECNALDKPPVQHSGLYPEAIQTDKGFCDALTKQPNANELMDHFSVVANDKPGTFKAVPYNIAYKQEMESIAAELEAAAAALDDTEAAFKNYLTVTAQSFRSNDWEPSNRAWVAMNATNSKWYSRIAPDEVYYDPCAWKAGFALQLARINTASLAWQQKLEPMKNDMENSLASMAGAPYKARDVKFKVPDFIDVVLNAGDQRPSSGATIGQSLPNWGPVAESGGRTVAMANLFTDADSFTSYKTAMSSLFCKATNEYAVRDNEDQLVTSMLHEIAHNLGPAHEYRVNGKTDVQAFGGPLSSTLEELKAQTSSMYLTTWLSNKQMFTEKRLREIQTSDVAWMFGHISRGMYTAEGKTLNYSQLSAIQLGSFIKQGAIEWKADESAANGTDTGCIEINYGKLNDAINSLEKTVLQIKSRADKATAETLKAEFVDGTNDFTKVKATITERWRRNPRATLVYSIRY